MQMFEPGFPELAVALRELNQLLTRVTGDGVLVKISIRAIRRINNVLINVKLMFSRLSVVAVKKQFVLHILSVCL